MNTNLIHGRLDAYWETGTEGVYWSLHDPSLPGYDGLFILHDDDRLRVIGANDELIWEGIIKLEYARNWTPFPANPGYGQQAVHGYWVHGLQDDLEPDRWADMFFARYRAVLEPGPTQELAPHPFTGPSTGMRDRLLTLSEGRQRELYRTTLYAWLYFYSDGTHQSLSENWDFTLAETLQLIGSPTDEQIVAAKTYPKHRDDVLMPFDLDRFVQLALLYGVYGALDWKFHDKDARVAWLNAGSPSPKDLLLEGNVAQVRDMLEA